MKERLIAKFGTDFKNAQSVEFGEFVENLVFEICNEKLEKIEQNEKLNALGKVVCALCNELAQNGALNQTSAKSLINGAKKALCNESENELYALIYEYDDLRKKISAKQRAISALIEDGYNELENIMQTLRDDEKTLIAGAVDELAKTTLALGEILKEASEMAFVSVVENGSDVEDTAHYTAKNIAFYAVCDGEFTRFRLKEIAKIIIDRAIFVANESKNTAPALIRGAVLGVYDGITKAAEKYRDDMSVSPDESVQTLEEKKAQIAQSEDIFEAVLNDAIARAEEPAKSEIAKISKEEFGGYLSKFVKISSELKDVLSEKISDSKFGEKAKDLGAQWKEKGEKIIENFELDEKFEGFKKEMSEKFAEIKADMAKNMSQKAREIGKKAYESALDALAKMKNKGESK